MSVRKRKWTTSKGEAKEAWIVDYTDGRGQRTIKTFEKKKDADDYLTTVKHEVKEGIHTPIGKSIKVAKAAEDWLSYIGGESRARNPRTI
jgi:integrase